MDPLRRDIVVLKVFSVLTALILSQTCKAGVVFQDDFESGNLNLWQSSGIVGAVRDNQMGGTFPSANGHYTALFSGGSALTNGEISVIFSTVGGQVYDLSFDFGTFAGQPQSIRVTVADATNNNMILDRSITDPTGTFNLANLFDHYSYQFIASSHLTRLKFNDASVSGYDSDGALDNVLITYSSSVPEPSSAAIATLFLIGSALRYRQRRRRF
jgi:hypothetical protein